MEIGTVIGILLAVVLGLLAFGYLTRKYGGWRLPGFPKTAPYAAQQGVIQKDELEEVLEAERLCERIPACTEEKWDPSVKRAAWKAYRNTMRFGGENPENRAVLAATAAAHKQQDRHIDDLGELSGMQLKRTKVIV